MGDIHGGIYQYCVYMLINLRDEKAFKTASSKMNDLSSSLDNTIIINNDNDNELLSMIDILKNAIINNSISSSLESTLFSHGISDERSLSLIISVNELKHDVKRILFDKAINEEQIPEEIVKDTIEKQYLKKRLGRPLLEGEIKDALTKFKVMKKAANYLCVHPLTMRKYMRMYGLEAEYWRPTRGTAIFNKSSGSRTINSLTV